jgi:hypothetical protein
MRGTVLYGPGDIRFEERETPAIVEPTDAIIRIAVTCVCGSDLWPYRGQQPIDGPTPVGHEYCGFGEEVGRAVKSVKPGQFVIGSFATSDNTCPHCHFGYQSSCVQREFISRAQAPILRVPQADGTLVPTPGIPSEDLLPSLLTTSDVLGTGWFAADTAHVKRGQRWWWSAMARSGCSGAQSNYNVGTPLSQEEIRGFDFMLGPEGKELPPGRGTAEEGAAIFAKRCAVCHGQNGEGGVVRRLGAPTATRFASE